MALYVFSLFWIIVLCLIWIPLCISKYKKWHHRILHCTQKITVCVSDIMEKKPLRGSMMYKPIFLTIKDGENYIIESAYFSTMSSIKKGEYYDLLVNPDDYQEFLYVEKKYNYGMVTDIICCILPIVFAVLLFFITLIKNS